VIRFQRILCPIDFSETSDRGLSHAIALATWYEAQLTILHVVPAFYECASSSVELHERGRDPCPSRDEILAQMRRSVARVPTALSPSLVTDEGRVHETIVNRATSLPADLLVLGTHGRGGFNRLFLGSVTEKVLRTASCPVLTVPPLAPATPPVPVTFKKILCAIDFSPSSLKALQYAVDLGRQAGGSVTVLHALEFEVPEDCDEIIEHARGRLHAQVAELRQTWCDIDEVVSMYRAYRAILLRAAGSGTDLIVMGAQGSGGVEVMFYGSNTQHVVRQARCPVLTVRA
jgi:nucleotide-binding universal stress UspA family protein